MQKQIKTRGQRITQHRENWNTADWLNSVIFLNPCVAPSVVLCFDSSIFVTFSWKQSEIWGTRREFCCLLLLGFLSVIYYRDKSIKLRYQITVFLNCRFSFEYIWQYFFISTSSIRPTWSKDILQLLVLTVYIIVYLCRVYTHRGV